MCYRTIAVEGEALLGPHAHPEITMHSLSFADYVAVMERDDWRGVADLMLDSAHKLAAAGARFLICPDNTAHQAMDHVVARSPLPWLHIAEVVAAEAAARLAVARRARSRFALAVAAAFAILLAAFPTMRFVSRNGEVTQAPRIVPDPLPTPIVLAAGLPGLTVTIPRPCDDCRRPDGAAGAEHEPPCIACRTPQP